MNLNRNVRAPIVKRRKGKKNQAFEHINENPITIEHYTKTH